MSIDWDDPITLYLYIPPGCLFLKTVSFIVESLLSLSKCKKGVTQNTHPSSNCTNIDFVLK